ncbi:MAG: hypothetical protein ACR2PX_00435 [Endozoicomonas sp.]|uniref:hypothetical protein n=1 Tax=Endozoicomonas sp. TaxID=1892382 RepID=UPI003D9ADE20
MYQVTPYPCYSNASGSSFIDLMAKPARASSQGEAVFDLKHKLMKCTKLSEELEHLTTLILSTKPDAKTHLQVREQWLHLGDCLDTVTAMKNDLKAQFCSIRRRLASHLDTQTPAMSSQPFVDTKTLSVEERSQQSVVEDLKLKLIKCTNLFEELERLTKQILSTTPSTKTLQGEQGHWPHRNELLGTVTAMKEELKAQYGCLQKRLNAHLKVQTPSVSDSSTSNPASSRSSESSQQPAVIALKHKLMKFTKLSEQLEHLTTEILTTKPSAESPEELTKQKLQLGNFLDKITEMKKGNYSAPSKG